MVIRNILSVIAGLATAFVLIGLSQQLSHSIYPLPESLDFSDPEAVKSAFLKIPVEAMLIVFAGYVVGVFAGGLVAALIAPLVAKRNAVVIGIILTLAGLVNLISMPHPTWFWASLLVYVPFALLGANAGLKVKRG